MDALPLIPACVLTFAAAYYLGKVSLMLFITSMEHSRRPVPEKSEVPATALRSADTVLS